MNTHIRQEERRFRPASWLTLVVFLTFVLLHPEAASARSAGKGASKASAKDSGAPSGSPIDEADEPSEAEAEEPEDGPDEEDPRNPFLKRIAPAPEALAPAPGLPESLTASESVEDEKGKAGGGVKKRFTEWSDPLQRRSVDEMHVAGVAASKRKQIAAIRFAQDPYQFVKPGSVVGLEKYRVTSVSVEGVVLEKNGAKLTFPVSNPSARDVYEKPSSSKEDR